MNIWQNTSFWTGVSVGVGSCAAWGLLFLFRPKITNILSLRLFRSNIIKLADRMTTRDMKLVFVVRTDCKMQKGKVAAQCSHAAVMAYKQASKLQPQMLKVWETSGQPKIVCRVDSEEEMLLVAQKASRLGLLTAMVRDAGRTQVVPGTKTVISIGPGPTHLIDECTHHLKLL